MPVRARRAFVARPDAILPMVTGGEIASRIAHHRHFQAAQMLQHVLPAPINIGKRAFRIINSLDIHRDPYAPENRQISVDQLAQS